MPDKIFIGKFPKGVTNYYQSFYNDNASWSTLFNAYVWRGQVERKRGTSFLGQLQRQVISAALPTFATTPWKFGPLALVAGAGNLITGPWATFNNASYNLEASSTITPGSVSVVVGVNTYTEPATPNGTLVGSPGGSGTINYSTGAITISGGGVGPLTGTFDYFPGLPVMGLRDFVVSAATSNFPVQLSFDTKYSYQVNQTVSPKEFFTTSYYKGTNTPFVWSGQDFQQFWTTNYNDSLWATNNKPGFHFVNGTYTSGSGTTNITFNFKSLGVNYPNLIVGDKVWFNEWATGGSTLDTQTGTVSTATDAVNGNYVVTFATARTAAGAGIAQLLTSSISGQDGIKWYDGDPTANTGVPIGNNLGWVNFAPPLTALTTSINNTPAGKYYLVGALIIQQFKDRLLFFSPYIQTSTGNFIQLIDVVLWSWNGTPYYNTVIPANQTFDGTAYYVDQTGKGGFISAGIEQPIRTVGNNEDVLLVGFGGNGRKTRFVYTGDDLSPFLFYNINAEMPSTATFSAVVLDKGTIDIGTYGICKTDQQGVERIDLDIPQEVFNIAENNNGIERVNAIRDFYREWIYFSYTYDNATAPYDVKFPNQTFLYNYREGNWAILYENWTSHGRFRNQELFSWATVPFKTWAEWNEPWNAGLSNTLIPDIIAGNPQGYVLTLDEGTGEGVSGTIFTITNSSGFTSIKSINHCLLKNDFIQLQNILGPTGYNGVVAKVLTVTDADNFIIDAPFINTAYLGLGQYKKMVVPLMITMQLNSYWTQGRKTRLGPQKYLFTTTANGQVTLNIYLSQDSNSVFNAGPIYPQPGSTNDSLMYSQVIYTCPESTNLGLTPLNTNLQQLNNPSSGTSPQQFMWHRNNVSLIGDTVQMGFTLSEAQMKNTNICYNEIALHGIDLIVSPSQLLS